MSRTAPSSRTIRPHLVARPGGRGFLGAYALVPFATFVPPVSYYLDHRHAGDDAPFRRFHAATPFFPLTGGRTLEGLRTFPPLALAVGLAAAALLRFRHPSLG